MQKQSSRTYKIRNHALFMKLLADLLLLRAVKQNAIPRRNLAPISRVSPEDLINLDLPFTILRVQDLHNPVKAEHRHQYIITDQPVVHNKQAIITLRKVFSDMREDALENIGLYLDEVEAGTPMHQNPYHLGRKDWEDQGASSKAGVNKVIEELKREREGIPTYPSVSLKDAWMYCLVSRHQNGLAHLPEFYWQQEGLPFYCAFYEDMNLYGQLNLNGLITDLGFVDYGRDNRFMYTPEECLERFYDGGEWDIEPPEL